MALRNRRDLSALQSGSVFDSHALWWLFERRHWDDVMRHVGHRLKCRACGGRACVSWSRDKAATISLLMPDEREWKRAISRFRS